MTVSDAEILFETLSTASGHFFGRATLNVPDRLNALSLDMVKALDKQLVEWAADDAIVGVLLDSRGDKSFCAGGDVLGLYHALIEQPGEVPNSVAEFFEHEYRLDYRIHRFTKPIACWGRGFVMGGGLGLFIGASHRIVTPSSRLGMPESSLGLYPDAGGSWFLTRLPRYLGEFLAVTGIPLSAADALFLDFADFAVPDDSYRAFMEAIIGTKWSTQREINSSRLSHLLGKLSVQLSGAESSVATYVDDIRSVIGCDSLEDMTERFKLLATSDDPWLARAGKSFVSGSPTSIALALEIQRRVKHLSLAEVFQLELQVSIRRAASHDFIEGVRARLVDKDGTPRWEPKDLQDVKSTIIDKFLCTGAGGESPLRDLV